MDKDEAALRASKGYQDALKEGTEAVKIAALRASQRARITAKHFKAATGVEPEHDDLERCNCTEAGSLLHQYCGWDWERDKPNFWPEDSASSSSNQRGTK